MAEFLEEASVKKVGQDHVKELLKLEEAKAREVLKLYKETRRDLIDRLMFTPAGTFTSQKLGGVLLQVEMGIAALTKRLNDGMLKASRDSLELGISHLVDELSSFEKEFKSGVIPINLDAATIAMEVESLNVTRYESSLRAYDADIRAQIARGLTEAVVQEASLGEVVQNIGAFLQREEWKLLQIARTELHNVYSQGKLTGMKELQADSIPDLKKALFHPMDDRTGDDSKKAAMMDLIVPINQPFRYSWKGKKRVFMAPPDRPNDRSILIPYRDAWEN